MADFQMSNTLDASALDRAIARAGTKQAETQAASQRALQALQHNTELKKSELGLISASLGSGASQLASDVGSVYGLTTGDMDNAMRVNGAQKAEEFRNSLPLSVRKRLAARSEAIDSVEGQWAKAGTAIWETLKDPALLTNLLVEQIPLMAAGGVAGRGVGLVTGSARAATAAAVFVPSALQGSSVGSQVYDELLALPDEVWEQNSDYRALRDQFGADNAKAEIALDRARAAGAASTVVSVGSQFGPGGMILDKALAGSSKGVAGNLVARVARGVAGEGAQEIVEEGGGQFIGNVAKSTVDSSQDLFEGVGEGAGLGLVGGGVFGGAAGAFSPTLKEREAAEERRADTEATNTAYANAVDTGDISELTNKDSVKTYNPSLAANALAQRLKSTELTPEERAKSQADLDTIVAEAALRTRNQANNVRPYTEEGKREMEAELAMYQQQLADPATAEADKEFLQLSIEDIQERLDLASKADPKQIKADQKKLTELEADLERINRAHRETAVAETLKTEDGGTTTVEELVQESQSEDTEQSTKAAGKIMTLMMANPQAVTAEAAAAMAANPKSGFTPEQRNYLRAYSEAEAATLSLDPASVRKDIFDGRKGFVGVRQYKEQMSQAMRTGDVAAAKKLVRQLSSFAADHRTKADATKKALDVSRLSKGKTYVIRDEAESRGWRVNRTAPAGWDRKKNRGLEIQASSERSVALVEQIADEAAAIEAVQRQLEAGLGMMNAAPAAPTPSPAETKATVQKAAESKPTQEAEQAKAPVEPGPEVAEETETDEDAESDQEVDEQSEPEAAEQDEDSEESTFLDDLMSDLNQEEEVSDDREGSLSQLKDAEPHIGNMTTEELAKGNPLTAYFTQTAGKEKSKSQRPLVKVKNFLSKVRKGETAFEAFLKETRDNIKNSLTPAQANLFNEFMFFAKYWDTRIDAIAKNPKAKDRGYWHRNYLNFLQEGGLDENTKTAVYFAAFSWIQENGANNGYNDASAIRAILGLRPDAEVTGAMWGEFGRIGTRDKLAMQSMGRNALQALGLKVNKDAPLNIEAQMQGALGALSLALLLDSKLVVQERSSHRLLKERDAINPNLSEAAKLKNAIKAAKTEHFFIRPMRDVNSRLKNQPVSSGVQRVLDATKGTSSVLQRAFGVEPGTVAPLDKPVDVKQETAQGTKQSLPKQLLKRLTASGKYAYRISADRAKTRSAFNRASLEKMAGVVDIDNQLNHVALVKSVQAKNGGLVRELDQVDEFEAIQRNKPEGVRALFHFMHNVWGQQRVGLHQNLINPQTRKIHRQIVSMVDWETDIDLNKPESWDDFKYAIAQGLGIKTDKMFMASALAKLDATLEEPLFKAAINALRRVDGLPEGQQLPQLDQDTIAAAVDKAGEGMHSLVALETYARFLNAQKTPGVTKFTTDIMYEVDGITNGPALAHALTGMMTSEMAQRFGFYSEGQAADYAEWKEAVGNLDLYEFVASETLTAVRELITQRPRSKSTLDDIEFFIGSIMKEDGSITSKGRNLVKQPLTALAFGSSLKSVLSDMGTDFIESVYVKMQDAANGRGGDTLSQVIQQLNQLLPPKERISPSISAEELMSLEFNSTQETAIKSSFDSTMGVGVEKALEKNFGEFIERRNTLNEGAQAMFAIYNFTYQHFRDELIQQKIADDKLAKRNNDAPAQDLTAEDEETIQKKIRSVLPLIHTAMSKEAGDIEAGLLSAKLDRTIAKGDEAPYTQEVHFGRAIPTNNPNGKSSLTKMDPRAMRVTPEDPGVGMVIMLVHALDSAIASAVYGTMAALNVHDALGMSLRSYIKGAKSLNQNTYNYLANYSLSLEMSEALDRSMKGFGTLLRDNPELRAKLATMHKMLPGEKFSKWSFNSAQVVTKLVAVQQNLAEQALYMERDKLRSLLDVQRVAQYGVDGGAHHVTAEERANVQEKLTAVEARIAALNAPNNPATEQAPAPEPAPQKPATKYPEDTPWGRTGEPLVESDPLLTKYLEKRPGITVGKLLPYLSKRIKESGNHAQMIAFQLKLLNQLKTTAPLDTPVHVIKPDTPYVETEGDVKTARGWYTIDDAVYIKSPDFVHSALTPELLVHEITHATLAKFIRDNPEHASVKELEVLLEKAREYVAANNLTQFNPAIENVHELVSWGMTNQAFMIDVLNQIRMPSDSLQRAAEEGREADTGMRRFIRAVAKIFFSNGTDEAYATNGVAILINNTAMLLEDASWSRAEDAANTAAPQTFMQRAPEPMEYNTFQVFEALGKGARKVLGQSHDTHLRTVLGRVVEAAYGVFESDKAPAERRAAVTAEDTFLKSLNTGEMPFVSDARDGLGLSEQEAFVLESVEVTMREAMSNNTGLQRGLQAQFNDELRALYSDARSRITERDFHDGDWNSATDEQKAEAREIYNLIFRKSRNDNGTSDFLSRFAAIGLTYQPLMEKLAQIEPRNERPRFSGNVFERLNQVFERAMTWLRYRMTGVNENQRGDERLIALAQKLAQIEAQRKTHLQAKRDAPDTVIEKGVKTLTDAAKAQVEKVAGSRMLRNSGIGVIRASAAVTRAVAGERGDAMMQKLLDVRDATHKGRRGFLASMIQEVMGPGAQFQTLLMAANKHQQDRQRIKNTFANAVLDAFGHKLTQAEKEVLTYGVLRTDMASLMTHFKDINVLEQMTRDKAFLKKQIATLEAQLSGKHVGYYIKQSKDLGYFMVTNKVVSDHHMMNAHNIAHLGGTKQILKDLDEQKHADQMMEIIDPLISLYALESMHKKKRDELKILANLMAGERARDGGHNGVATLLAIHQSMQDDAKNSLFEGNPVHMIKGYTKELYNPGIEVVAANDVDGQKLIAAGYKASNDYLEQDPADPSEKRRLYVLHNRGLADYVTGIASMSGKRTKGWTEHGGLSHSGDGELMYKNLKRTQDFARKKEGNIDRMLNLTAAQAAQYDPDKAASGERMAPVLNLNGQVVNYRYLMKAKTKDKLLERDNRVDQVVGAMAASIFDKAGSEELNNEAMRALKEQYEKDYPTNPEGFIAFGPNSRDPSIRESYNLLPEATKRRIYEIWGENEMMIRPDQLDLTFGYRKLSMTDIFSQESRDARAARDAADERTIRDIAADTFIALAESVLGPRAGRILRSGGDIWQELVREIKDIWVIKSLFTLMGNITSNVTLLWGLGMGPIDIVKYHVVAWKNTQSFERDRKELEAIQNQIKWGVGIDDMDAAEQRIIELEDALNRNPVKELVDAGMLQTIVEDVSMEDDPYSYKSRLVRKIEEKTENLPNAVKTGAKFMYMAHDTTPYKLLSLMTQRSDFMARYALIQHMTTRKNPMTKEAAMKLAMDAFVNYDIPTHRGVQYLNDMGLIWFTKYYIRIQKVIVHLYKENPARALSLLVLNNYFSGLADILDSGFWGRIGNPFSTGALQYPGALDEIITVKGALSPFN